MSFNNQATPTASNGPVPDRSFSPLSPSAFSFLKGTLLSPLPFNNHVFTPCHLDSPMNAPEGGCTRSWNIAVKTETTSFMEQQETPFDAGSWSNDLHEVLLQTLSQPTPRETIATRRALHSRPPPLSSYVSDGESPDSTPVSSDVEDASPKQQYGLRRKLKRSYRDLADSELVSFKPVPLPQIAEVDEEAVDYLVEERLVPLNESDANDEFVKAALMEDSVEAKRDAFPALIAKAKSLLKSRFSHFDESTCANAILSAFTKDDKAGRPLPKSCQELLRVATEEVASTRKRQKELKTHRRSLLQNQVDDSFVCHSQGCNKTYTTAEGLRLHIRNHHEVDKKWICHATDCNSERAFVRQADLRMHLIRMHSPVRPFPCRVPDCNKTFACHSELRRHIGVEHLDLVHNLIHEANKSR